MEPAFGTPGHIVHGTLLGSGLANVSSVTFSSGKVSATVSEGTTNAQVPVLVSVAGDATPNTLTFTAATPLGTTNSSPFQVVGTPGISSIDPLSTTAESDAFTLT